VRIAIVGQHPVPQPGWRGVLSVFAAKWFAAAGDEVDLFIPMEDRAAYEAFLRRAGIVDLDELRKFGADFRIRPICLDEPRLPGQYDGLLWHVPRAINDSGLRTHARAACTVFTANTGKFVVTPVASNIDLLRDRFRAFDLVAFGLRQDVDLIDADPVARAEFAGRYCHAPRGAEPGMLRADRKGSAPVIGLDTPNTPDPRAIAHYRPALEIVRERYPDVEVLALGGGISLDWVTGLGNRPWPDACADFFERLWLYLVIDYRHSSTHLGRMARLMPAEWGTRATYEFQNVEAQMAGAAVVAHPENVIEELFDPGVSWLRYEDYDDPEAIAQVMIEGIERHDFHRAGSREWAVSRFTWQDSIASWRQGIQGLVENGYRRAT
jgi:glycosyltransferase involved in cell wall biosynthesis